MAGKIHTLALSENNVYVVEESSLMYTNAPEAASISEEFIVPRRRNAKKHALAQSEVEAGVEDNAVYVVEESSLMYTNAPEAASISEEFIVPRRGTTWARPEAGKPIDAWGFTAGAHPHDGGSAPTVVCEADGFYSQPANNSDLLGLDGFTWQMFSVPMSEGHAAHPFLVPQARSEGVGEFVQVGSDGDHWHAAEARAPLQRIDKSTDLQYNLPNNQGRQNKEAVRRLWMLRNSQSSSDDIVLGGVHNAEEVYAVNVLPSAKNYIMVG